MSRNVNDALIDVLQSIDRDGTIVRSRGGDQRETLGTLITLDRPRERVLTVPHRNNNIFAQVAETLWVLAGRDDLDFLSRFLPRADQFSDDGTTWRAAYGPRLRFWGPDRVDQLEAVRARFGEDPLTKRAVATIFDPTLDHVDSLDVPCNNWLHFLQRDGALHLNVAVRANDAIWGFSGINVFEWSVLQEVMACTLGWSIGPMSWFVGTMHVYERHWDLARRITGTGPVGTVYDFGIPALPVRTGLDSLDATLARVFAVDDCARRGDQDRARLLNERIDDPFFGAAATLLRAAACWSSSQDAAASMRIVDELPLSDLRVGATEYLCRRSGDRTLPRLGQERDYLAYYWRAVDASRSARPVETSGPAVGRVLTDSVAGSGGWPAA